jgi:hemerythrin
MSDTVDSTIVAWDDKYLLGIPVIDEQHKKLVLMANELYAGCLQGGAEADACFKRIIHGLVDYINQHFAFEEKLLKGLAYPNFAAHKAEHDGFIRNVVQNVKDYEAGKPFVANNFARYLRDWVLQHIAFTDKKYVAFVKPKMWPVGYVK